MSTWVKKKTYSQGILIHTDIVFDIGFFFKSEEKKIKVRNIIWKKNRNNSGWPKQNLI